jgi:hypothetical protein
MKKKTKNIAAKRAIEVGDATLKFVCDTSEMDEVLERIERSFRAFTMEWKRKKKSK